MAANNTKMNISYTIKAIDRFTKTHQKLTKQLSQIESQLEQVAGTHVINIDADTKIAEKQLKDVEDAVDDIPRKKSIHIFVENAKKVTKDFDNIRNRMSDISRDMGEIGQNTFAGSIFTVAAPTLMAVAGGLGAIASAALPATLGLAGLAAVAIPTISSLSDKYGALKEAREKLAGATTEKEIAKATEELNAAQSQFNETQLESVRALDKFNQFFDEFSARLEKPVLTVFNNSLILAENLLRVLEPAIVGTLIAVNNLIDAFNRNIEAEDMQRFFQWVGETAGPNLEKLGKAVGNFILGFALMMMAFDPLAQGFMDGFLRMSEEFRNWSATLSENQAFQDFVDTVSANAPVVLAFFGNLALLLWNLIIAMEPFATWLMEVSNKAMEMFNTFLTNHPVLAQVIGTILVLIGVFTALFTPIALLVTGLRILAPVFTLLWAAAVRVGSFFMGVLLPAIGRVAMAFLRFLGPIGIVIQIVILLATVIFQNWDAIAAWTQNIWENVLPASVTGALESIWTSVTSGFTAIVDFVKGKNSEMATDTESNLSSMSSSFSGNLPYVEGTVNDSFSRMHSSVGSNMGLMNSSVTSGLGDISSTASAELTSLETTFTSGLDSMYTTTDTSFMDMSTSVSDYMSDMGLDVSDNWTDIAQISTEQSGLMAQSASDSMETKVAAVTTGMQKIKTVITNTWSAIIAYLNGINLYGTGQNIIQGLANGVASMSGHLSGVMSSVVSSAVASAKAQLDINSPSRVFYEFGEFVDQGFINGMLSMVRKVSGASEKMVTAAVPKQPAYANSIFAAKSNASDAADKNQVDVQVNVASTPVVIDKRVLGEIIYETVAELNSAREYRARRFGGEPLA